jgi:hypothetical protein
MSVPSNIELFSPLSSPARKIFLYVYIMRKFWQVMARIREEADPVPISKEILVDMYYRVSGRK